MLPVLFIGQVQRLPADTGARIESVCRSMKLMMVISEQQPQR